MKRPPRNRHSLRVFGGFLVLALVTTLTGTASASSPSGNSLCGSPDRVSVDTRAEAEEVSLARITLRKQGKKQKEIDEFLRTTYGLVRVTGDRKPKTRSINGASSLTLFAPEFLQDICISRRYQVFADWEFSNNLDGIENGHSLGCIGTCDVAGDDGVGVAFNRNAQSVADYFVTTCGKTDTFPCSNSAWHVEDANQAGAGFAGLDKMNYNGACCRHDYNFYWGSLVYIIANVGCGSFQAFSKYGHTWNSTAVSVSIGYPLNVGLSFSSSENRWQLGSQPSDTITPC